MGGGHHHKPKVTIPDYKTYKIEGIPQLEAVQKHLESKGLRDPWLRLVSSNNMNALSQT